MTSQYETNLWSTHVNIVRLAEPIRHCVRWRTQVFKIKGFVLQAFPFFPSPCPLFNFLVLVSFYARSKPKVPFLLRNQTETLATQATILGTFFKSHDCSCLWLLEDWLGYWHDKLSNKIAPIKLNKLSTVSHVHIFPLFQCTHKEKPRLSCFVPNKKQRNLRSCWSNAKRV